MANSNVEIEISEDKNNSRYLMKTRLIGAVTEEEALKIISNKEVYDRIYRFGTSSIKELVDAVDKNANEIKPHSPKEDKCMRLVAALNEIKINSSPIFVNVERKQLFISEPISFISEINNSYNKVYINTTKSSTMILNKMEI